MDKLKSYNKLMAVKNQNIVNFFHSNTNQRFVYNLYELELFYDRNHKIWTNTSQPIEGGYDKFTIIETNFE
jgi:hypothetical protein